MTEARRELIVEAARAMQARALYPSLHWPKLHAIQHRDVAVALAEAAFEVFASHPILAAVDISASVEIDTELVKEDSHD